MKKNTYSIENNKPFIKNTYYSIIDVLNILYKIEKNQTIIKGKMFNKTASLANWTWVLFHGYLARKLYIFRTHLEEIGKNTESIRTKYKKIWQQVWYEGHYKFELSQFKYKIKLREYLDCFNDLIILCGKNNKPISLNKIDKINVNDNLIADLIKIS